MWEEHSRESEMLWEEFLLVEVAYEGRYGCIICTSVTVATDGAREVGKSHIMQGVIHDGKELEPLLLARRRLE